MDEIMPFLTKLTKSAHHDENKLLETSFNRIFSSMADSKKLKSKNYHKSLYHHPHSQSERKKKLKFVQNW